MHENCTCFCLNCKKHFENVERFNDHLSNCIDEKTLDSLLQKLEATKNRQDLYCVRDFKRGPKQQQKFKLRCINCGAKLSNTKRAKSEHICEIETECFLCATKIPSKLLKCHTELCLNQSESKLKDFEFLAQMNARNGTCDDHVESVRPTPVASPCIEQNPKLSQPSSTNSSQPKSDADSQPLSTSSVSSAEQNMVNTQAKRDRERESYESRSFWSNIRRSLENPTDNSINQIVTRSKAVKNSNKPQMTAKSTTNSDSQSHPENKSDKTNLKDKLRRSKDFKTIVDITPMIDFFHSSCNNSEKRLILSSILDEKMEESEISLFASLFKVKKSYIRMLISERKIKLLEGKNYPIMVTRSDDGQINIDYDIKKQIIEELLDNAQLFPGEQEFTYKRCSDVKDRALIDVYKTKFKIEQQRNVDYYAASRRILPVKYKTYYDEKIKPVYPNISFNQFRAICPYNIHEVAMNWKSFCICHFCTNWSFRKRIHIDVTNF